MFEVKKLIKRLLLTLFPETVVRLISVIPEWVRRRIILLKHKVGIIKDLETSFGYSVISFPKRHCFFGYYDVSPFHPINDSVLNIAVDGINNDVDIYLFDKKTGGNSLLTKSNVWNWQQGCRLRWFDNDSILFNDFKEGKYYSRVFNIIKKQDTNQYAIPLYDVDHNRNFGISLNFSRLGVKRPGYGYTLTTYIEKDLEDEGIDIVNLHSGLIQRVVKFNELAPYLTCKDKDLHHYYINHLSFSPNGNQFMFFFINGNTARHDAYMFVYNICENIIIPLELHDKVSHYTWLSEDEILATVYNDNMECGYYVYSVKEQSRHLFNNINRDGHPSLFKNNLLLTDTYPNSSFVQRLFLMDDEGEKTIIADIFSTPKMGGETRTDLHPRINSKKNLFCIDSNRNGFREMCVFDINYI